MPDKLKDKIPKVSQLLNTPISLHVDQLIIEVMRLMEHTGQHKLPVFNEGLKVGTISLSDIQIFLDHEKEMNLYYHKLNYTMESLLVLKYGHLKALFPEDEDC